MEKLLKNKRFFNILTLIFIAEFLVFSNISSADEFESIQLDELDKYLELSESDLNKIINSLRQVFTDEKLNLWSSGYSADEEIAINEILLEAIKKQFINYLLRDIPIETTWKIIKGTIDIVRIYVDPLVGLDKLEKQTVQKAIEYGMKILLGNEIRISPGTIELEYSSYKGIKKEVILQYIIVYKQTNIKSAKIEIRLYSPVYIEAPEFLTKKGLNLQSDLPPFIATIKGVIEKTQFDNYQWIDENGKLTHPSVNIDFPPEVPDLGIKPLSLWEKYLLKPIETTIKDVEVITKVTGKSPGFTDIWNEVKKFIERIKSFTPAGLTESVQIEQNKAVIDEAIKLLTITETPKGLVEAGPQQTVEDSPKQATEEISLEELQEMLDDIAEKIDVLSQKFAELALAQASQTVSQQQEKEQLNKKEEIIEDEDEEIIEDELVEESPQQISKEICWVNINTASKEELEKITGVGPVLAERIINARPFSSIYNLINVNGIGEKTLEKIINQNCAYVENDTGPPVVSSGGGGGSSGGSGGSSGGGSPPVTLSSTSTIVEILITEVQIKTASSTDYDFVELYNPATSSINISGFQLKKRSSTGSEYSIRIFPADSIIPAQGYFLWLNSDYASATQISADATSSQTLAQNNSVALFDDNGNILDAVAWGTGTNPFVESNPFPQNPIENQSLGRKWSTTTQNYLDTDDNQNDFEIQIPTPKTQNQTTEPAPESPSEEPLLTVVINEIAWMGTSATNSSDEWIELFNNTTSTIDLTGWTLSWSHGTTSHSVTFSTSSIPAENFYLLERTSGTVTDVAEDQIFTGGLNNDGEKLELRNSAGRLIDVVDCSLGWFAGTTTPIYASMERISPTSTATSTNWANNNQITRNGLDVNGNKINGTPKNWNSVFRSQTEISGVVDYPVLTYLGSPYVVIGTLTVPVGYTLTVEPGVTLKFKNQAHLEIEGTLKAIGQEDKKITFTSIDDLSYWQGIYFSPSSIDSELNWTEIRYAQGSPWEGYPAILINDSSVNFKNSIIEKYYLQGMKLINSTSTIEKTNIFGPGTISEGSGTVGITVIGGSPAILNCDLIRGNEYGISIQTVGLPLIEGNNFEENCYPIWVANSSATLKDNKSQNNSNMYNGIVFSGPIPQNTTWHKNELPYIIGRPNSGWTVNINPGVVLTIEPGVRVEFGNGSDLTVEGTLLAGEIGQEPVIFTAYPGQAPWRKIYFAISSLNSILNNVIVSQGAGYNLAGQIYVDGTSIQFINSTSSKSFYSGIFLANSSSTIANSYFGNNQIGIAIQGAETVPQLSNNSFENNAKCDIYWPNSGGICEAMATATPGVTFECNCCPY